MSPVGWPATVPPGASLVDVACPMLTRCEYGYRSVVV